MVWVAPKCNATFDIRMVPIVHNRDTTSCCTLSQQSYSDVLEKVSTLRWKDSLMMSGDTLLFLSSIYTNLSGHHLKITEFPGRTECVSTRQSGEMPPAALDCSKETIGCPCLLLIGKAPVVLLRPKFQFHAIIVSFNSKVQSKL